MAEPPEKKRVRLHYGSLEEQEKARLEREGAAAENGGLSAAVVAGIKAGNINISKGEL